MLLWEFQMGAELQWGTRFVIEIFTLYETGAAPKDWSVQSWCCAPSEGLDRVHVSH